MEIVKNEFQQFFDAYIHHTQPQLEALELQYKDYAAWQNQLLADEQQMEKAHAFWREQLSGNLPPLNLPYDYSRSTGSKESAGYRWVIPMELITPLQGLAEERRASLFMVLLAGFKLMLAQVSGQEEILLAIPAAARRHEALKNIIGMFVNTLILCNRVQTDEPFLDFFQRLLNNTFKVLEFQDIPLELICGQLKIKYPDISVFFNMVNIGSSTQGVLEHLESVHTEKVQNAKFDIVCYLTEYDNGIEIQCHYHKDRFSPMTIEKLMGLYKELLGKIAAEPSKRIGEYFTTAKKRKLMRRAD